MELSRDTPLFDRQLNVKILQGSNQTASDAREVPLTFRILQGSFHASQGHERVIHFELTDESDPYFLYLLELSEQDFPLLKREQSILVDFAAFPSKLIELLEQCLPSECGNAEDDILTDVAAQQQQSALAYYVRLDINSGSFSVVESNRFKQLTHISLQLRPGNDSSIKAYLASRLTHSNMTSRRLLRDLANTKDQLNAEMSLRRDMTEELREFRSSRDLDLHSVRNTHAEEILKVQTQAAETLERSRESFQKQITQLRATSDEAAKLSSDRISELESALLHEKQERAQSDFKVRELSKGSENTGVERARLVEECTELRQSLRQSEASRSNLEKEVVKLQMKAESLALQISDREEAVSRAGELQRASEEAKRATEEQLALYKNSLEAVTEKLSSAVAEIKKGNQEIARQQQEIGQLKDKLSMKSDVIRKQEALVQELRTRVGDAESAYQRSNCAASESKTEAAALQRELDTTKSNLAECMDNLARQNEVVGYLNRELTKCALGGGSTPLGAESFRDDSFKENSPSFMSPGNMLSSERETPRTFSGGLSTGGRKYQSADSFIKSSVAPPASTNSKVQAR